MEYLQAYGRITRICGVGSTEAYQELNEMLAKRLIIRQGKGRSTYIASMGGTDPMEPVTLDTLQSFLQRLGERYPSAGILYLLGGSALCLLGNPRTTVDVDYAFELDAESVEQ